jgi:hypothetical protein
MLLIMLRYIIIFFFKEENGIRSATIFPKSSILLSNKKLLRNKNIFQMTFEVNFLFNIYFFQNEENGGNWLK